MSFWQWCLHGAKTCSLSFISVGKAEVVRYACRMRLWRLDRDGTHWWFAVGLLQCYIRAAGFRWLSKVWLRGGCLWFETMGWFWGWFTMKCQVWQTGSTHRRPRCWMTSERDHHTVGWVIMSRGAPCFANGGKKVITCLARHALCHPSLSITSTQWGAFPNPAHWKEPWNSFKIYEYRIV